MGEELGGYRDVDYFHILGGAVCKAQPAVDEEVGMRGAQDERVENIRQGEKTPHQYDCENHQDPDDMGAEDVQMVPEGHL